MRSTEVIYTIECNADPHLFDEDWNNDPKLVEEINENGGVICEGEGGMGAWCEDCRFGKVMIDYE